MLCSGKVLGIHALSLRSERCTHPAFCEAAPIPAFCEVAPKPGFFTKWHTSLFFEKWHPCTHVCFLRSCNHACFCSFVEKLQGSNAVARDFLWRQRRCLPASGSSSSKNSVRSSSGGVRMSPTVIGCGSVRRLLVDLPTFSPMFSTISFRYSRERAL